MLLKFLKESAEICSAERPNCILEASAIHIWAQFGESIRLLMRRCCGENQPGPGSRSRQLKFWGDAGQVCVTSSFSLLLCPLLLLVFHGRKMTLTAHCTCLFSLISHPDRAEKQNVPCSIRITWKCIPEVCPSKIWDKHKQQNMPLGGNGQSGAWVSGPEKWGWFRDPPQCRRASLQ